MSHFETKYLFVALTVFLTACGGGGGSDSGASGAATSGAPGIQYQSVAINFTANIQNASVSPVNSGGPISSCVAVPTLPSNLKLDQTSCTISGAPRGPSPLTSYKITATGPDGSSSTTVAINAVLPSETLTGSLNIFWGQNGLAAPSITNLSVRAQVQQSDGKMLVLADNSTTQLNLLRFNTDGSVDATFGSGGAIAYNCTSFGNPNCESYNLLLQSDGKIIIAGISGNANPNDGFYVLRLNADGSGDSSFGTGGVALVLFTNGIETGFSSASLDPDTGNIVLAGTNWTGAQWSPVVARLTPSGALDSTFGTAGKVNLTGFTSYIVRSFGYDVNTKKYYIGASTGSGGALLRLTPAGVLDTTFGSSGSVSFSDSNFMSQAKESIAVQFADGDILIVAGSHLLRFSLAGSLDTTFGTSGVVTLASAAVSVQLIVEASEKILVAAGQSSGSASVTRYSALGVKDTSYGSSGVFSLGNSYGNVQFVNAVVNSSSGLLMFLAQSVTSGNAIYLFGLN